ncbi:hypothetical protein Tco_0970295 [Tanacetum coccineum]
MGKSCDRQFAGSEVGGKSYADVRLDAKRWNFKSGDMVIVESILTWKGVIRFGKRGKLSPRYIGPFKIIKRIVPVAYKLELLDKLYGIHNTFHVLNLKKCLADENLVIPLEEIQLDDKLHFIEEPVEIMDREVKQLKQSRIPIVKVRWNSRRVTEILKAAQKAVKEDLALNKKVLEANKAYTRIYHNITKLLCLAKTFDFYGLKSSDALSPNDEINAHMEKEDKIKKAAEEAKMHGYAVSSLMDTAYWSSEIIKDLWERHEEAVVSLLTSGHPLKVTEILKAAQKAVKEDLALNKKVLEANKAYTRNSNNITKLLCLAKTFDFSGLKSLVETVKALLMLKMIT